MALFGHNDFPERFTYKVDFPIFRRFYYKKVAYKFVNIFPIWSRLALVGIL